MTWENQSDPAVADTQALEDQEFSSSTNTTQQLNAPAAAIDDVTDEDIERAIAEIQDAIRKVPR
jgi:outer membrane receptor for ferrienterochelin and colicin